MFYKDETDPAVLRFIDRVCALAPADWDRLGDYPGRAAAESGEAGDEPGRSGVVMGALDGWLRSLHAPRWRWSGVGPFRRLGEVLDRPYVSSYARSTVLGALGAVQSRDGFGLEELRSATSIRPETLASIERSNRQYVASLWRRYRDVEPVIPWDSLGAGPPPWLRDEPSRSR